MEKVSGVGRCRAIALYSFLVCYGRESRELQNSAEACEVGSQTIRVIREIRG
jgi:hypothetical protein